ncbi:MAG: transglutaminase family protein [Propionibacteriaceae bacterium]
MRPVDRLWTGTAVAGAIGGMTLLPLTADAGYLYPSWLLIAVLSVAAVVGDRLRLTKVAVNAIQLLLAAALAISLAIGPGPSDVVWYARLVPLLRSGYDHIQTSAAPMPPDPGAQIILTLIVVLLFLVAGIIADTLERPAWALAPLLALYLIPAIALRSDVNAVSFLVVVIGYLAILFADGLNSDRQWTRNLSHDSAMARGSRGIWRLSVVIATPALLGAVILGVMLPALSPTFFSSLRPNGTGPIEMVDPQLDLRRNLEQGASREVLSYTTNKPSGVYLRLATLPVLNADGWSQSQVTLKQGALGPVPGVSGAPSGGPRITNVQIEDFASMYLPVPYAPRTQNATGEWSYDPASLMIIATGNNRSRATVGQRYTVESWDIEPNGAALSTAKAGVPGGQAMTLEIPTDTPADIVRLVNQLTSAVPAPALKAAAIQAYLRSSQFSYSVQGASGKTSYQAIETFLFQTKTGYCVQYAAAMALMARIAGIPSRVAVGFLPGTQSGDRWLVTSHDMHAWPELYFEGQGWVRFEPTPSVAVPPPWTVLAPNQPSAAPSSAARPTASSSVQPTAEATVVHQSPGAVGVTASDASRTRTVILVVVLAVVLLLLLTPTVLRRLLRRSRLAPTDDPHESIANAWLEVRDTWLDLGHRWPRGTPRQIGAVVAEGLPRSIAETSLSDVVNAVEQSRYAEHLDDLEGLRRQVDAVLSGLHASRPWYRRLGHVLLPASLTFGLRLWWRRVTAARATEVIADEAPQSAETDDAAYKRPVDSGTR